MSYTADDCIQHAADALRGTSFRTAEEQAIAIRNVALAISKAYFVGGDDAAGELQVDIQEFIRTDPRVKAVFEEILKEHAAQVLAAYGIEEPDGKG